MNQVTVAALFGAITAASGIIMVWKDEYNFESIRTNCFSIATKNVLANEWTWPKYFPYGDAETLSWNYRFPKQVKEFTEDNADLLTLQEIDRFDPEVTGETFQNERPHAELTGFWEPSLQSLGYSSRFQEQNPKHIGIFVAPKTDRWVEITSGGVSLGEATKHIPP